ncbi:MAG: RNA polymerase sigma factor SigZ [Blastocatellia bacterium]
MITTEQIWHEYRGALLGFIRREVGETATAEDILQDVFLKVHTGLPELADEQQLKSWLYRVARNAVVDHFRRLKPMTDVPEDLAAAEHITPAAHELMGRLDTMFRDMMTDLPDIYREALVRSELEGLPLKQLADAEGISLSAAKARVQRGREKLRTELLNCCDFEFNRNGDLAHYERKRNTDCDPCAC